MLALSREQPWQVAHQSQQYSAGACEGSVIQHVVGRGSRGGINTAAAFAAHINYTNR